MGREKELPAGGGAPAPIPQPTFSPRGFGGSKDAQISVWIEDRQIVLPERDLCEAASVLDQATGGCVPLAGYAKSVASALLALQRRGVLTLHV